MVCVICLYICVLYECMCATLYHIHTVNLCWLHVLNRGHACHASGDLEESQSHKMQRLRSACI